MILFQKALIYLRRLRYPGSSVYWERRYASGGTSGSGSSGTLAAYKSGVVNRFVQDHSIQSITEFGCGDGQQLQLARYPAYVGLDISSAAIVRCQTIFANDSSKQFFPYDPFRFDPETFKADLTLSLEVVFHLTEDETYHLYLQHLFASAARWVIIFSSNDDDTTKGVFPHFKPRRFTTDIPPNWVLRQQLPNPHAAMSVSEFFIFEKLPFHATFASP